MKKILLVNFHECPENLHLERALAGALRSGEAVLDSLHDFEAAYGFIERPPAPGTGRIKYRGPQTLETGLRGPYDRMVFLDFPKRKRCAAPFIRLARARRAGGKIFLANHLIPMPGQNFTADAARRFNLFSGFRAASVLESDDAGLWRTVGFEKEKIFKRNYAVDCAYYRPGQAGPVNYIFSAGSAGRDFPALAVAAKRAGLRVKIFSDAKIALPAGHKRACEIFPLSENLAGLNAAVSGSGLAVLPIKNGYRNEAAGNSMAFIAMACAVPVLTLRTPYMERYIKEGVNGFLYDALSVRELEAGIRKIAALSPGARAGLGRAARKTVLRRASLEAFCSAFIKQFI